MSRRPPGMNPPSRVVDRRPPAVNRSTPGVDRQPPGVDRRPHGMNRRDPGMDRQPRGVDRRPRGIDRRPPGVDRPRVGVDRITRAGLRPWAAIGSPRDPVEGSDPSVISFIARRGTRPAALTPPTRLPPRPDLEGRTCGPMSRGRRRGAGGPRRQRCRRGSAGAGLEARLGRTASLPRARGCREVTQLAQHLPDNSPIGFRNADGSGDLFGRGTGRDVFLSVQGHENILARHHRRSKTPCEPLLSEGVSKVLPGHPSTQVGTLTGPAPPGAAG